MLAGGLDSQADDAAFFELAYGISAEGNFEGSNVLQQAASNAELGEKYGLSDIEVRLRLERLHNTLLAARERRIPPGVDDKVLTGWNALALITFAEAARYLKRADYLEIARANAGFILRELLQDGDLLRSWRNGIARHRAYLEDYASLILGLLALYQSDPDPAWFTAAEKLAAALQEHFTDPDGGFFDTHADQENLIVRPKDVQDNATPSGNALAALAFLQLSGFTGRGDWRELAEGMLARISAAAGRYPTAFAQWLCAMDFSLAQVREVAILGPGNSPVRQEMVAKLWSTFRPDMLAAISDYPPSSEAPELLARRPLLNNQTTAYVCQGFVCLTPVNTPEALQQQLGGLQ